MFSLKFCHETDILLLGYACHDLGCLLRFGTSLATQAEPLGAALLYGIRQARVTGPEIYFTLIRLLNVLEVINENIGDSIANMSHFFSIIAYFSLFSPFFDF